METTFVVSMLAEAEVSGQLSRAALGVPLTFTVSLTVGSAAMASATVMPFPATRAKTVKPPFWLSKLLLLLPKFTKN